MLQWWPIGTDTSHKYWFISLQTTLLENCPHYLQKFCLHYLIYIDLIIYIYFLIFGDWDLIALFYSPFCAVAFTWFLIKFHVFYAFCYNFCNGCNASFFVKVRYFEGPWCASKDIKYLIFCSRRFYLDPARHFISEILSRVYSFSCSVSLVHAILFAKDTFNYFILLIFVMDALFKEIVLHSPMVYSV